MIATHPVSLTLSDEDRNLLQNVVYRGQNWRARERAKTLLLLGAPERGKSWSAAEPNFSQVSLVVATVLGWTPTC